MQNYTMSHHHHSLLKGLLTTACILIGWNEKTPLNEFVGENPEKFVTSLTNLELPNQNIMPLMSKHVKPYSDLTDLSENVKAVVSRIFVDIIAIFPPSINFKIFCNLTHTEIGRYSKYTRALAIPISQ